MKPVRAKFEINNGIITKIETLENGVSVSIDGENIFYPNAYAYQGFADSHGHIAGLGIMLNVTNFEKAKSAEECADKAFKKPSFRGTWVFGRGWNHEKWKNNELPTAKILDKYFPDVPCYFVRVDGHSAWVNTKAMQICRIGRTSANPKGGSILKDGSGNPTGILLDNAMEIAFNKMPKFSTDQLKKMIQNATKELKKNGLTHVHDMDLDPRLIPLFKELDNDDQLNINIHAYVKAQNDEWSKAISEPYYGNKFNITGLKFYADGALGSRSASLLDSYTDNPSSRGLLLTDRENLFKKTKIGIEHGFQIATHAIGDNANKMVVSAYQMLRNQKIAKPEDILRLEHGQIISPEDIKRIADNNIFCSVQPIHCISDYSMAKKRIGKRCQNAYLWKTLLSNNIRIAGGSDFPIESHNPLIGLDAFIRRVPFNEETSWFPKEILSPDEAITAYTTSPKEFLGIDDSEYGIALGKKAEFTILDSKVSEIREPLQNSINILETIC